LKYPSIRLKNTHSKKNAYSNFLYENRPKISKKKTYFPIKIAQKTPKNTQKHSKNTYFPMKKRSKTPQKQPDLLFLSGRTPPAFLSFSYETAEKTPENGANSPKISALSRKNGKNTENSIENTENSIENTEKTPENAENSVQSGNFRLEKVLFTRFQRGLAVTPAEKGIFACEEGCVDQKYWRFVRKFGYCGHFGVFFFWIWGIILAFYICGCIEILKKKKKLKKKIDKYI
jgi:hypothetical protein